MRLKHKLPIYSEVSHLSLTGDELIQLKKIVDELNTQFKSVLEINKLLCGIHHSLATSVYDNFMQIGLTDCETNTQDTTIEQCDNINSGIMSEGLIKSIKSKKRQSTDINSPLNERMYTVKNDVYLKYAATFDGIFSKFKSKPTRIRLVKLNAGTIVSPHIDYDPSYSVRIIIPIVSPSDCLNIFWNHGDTVSFNMKDGTAYFLNTAYRHAVVNLSDEDRYTLLVSVDGTDDIDDLIK
jgi:hypothetical protein